MKNKTSIAFLVLLAIVIIMTIIANPTDAATSGRDPGVVNVILKFGQVAHVSCAEGLPDANAEEVAPGHWAIWCDSGAGTQ